MLYSSIEVSTVLAHCWGCFQLSKGFNCARRECKCYCKVNKSSTAAGAGCSAIRAQVLSLIVSSSLPELDSPAYTAKYPLLVKALPAVLGSCKCFCSRHIDCECFTLNIVDLVELTFLFLHFWQLVLRWTTVFSLSTIFTLNPKP